MLLARKHLVLHLTSVDIGMGATSLAFCAVLNLSTVCLFYIILLKWYFLVEIHISITRFDFLILFCHSFFYVLLKIKNHYVHILDILFNHIGHI